MKNKNKKTKIEAKEASTEMEGGGVCQCLHEPNRVMSLPRGESKIIFYDLRKAIREKRVCELRPKSTKVFLPRRPESDRRGLLPFYALRHLDTMPFPLPLRRTKNCPAIQFL